MRNATDSDAPEAMPRFDYEAYVHMRRLNAALTKWSLLAVCWLLLGVSAAGVGYKLRAAPAVVGMDPAGRAHQLQLLSAPSQEK